ncbi:dehydrogenase [Leptospira levettii]|uniref:Dehydrogenase n=1 Tax=Leptospira levettii TaxID=2023178 RepID=A0ABY2MS05_9LEPT|nr:phosphoglycerate dehydrogenase [Leptospira levettii]MCW7509270.1 phosphoglycerate dehydrogenase [Leptospira levettii]MCW7520359.1 phosphoglycerate dehydrogenase [Leptospira levettii]TGL73610.1 dehydrogenase [Leptospira levettii]TGM25907.1 dehydrogenase [Leptospira levettii]TGM33418.1 dehydrogenase [Leptospira levettii]
MKRIFVSTYPFGQYNEEPISILKKEGWDVVLNPTKRKLTSEEVAEYAKNVDAIIAGTEDLTPLILKNPDLKIISRVGIGLDSVPLQLCRDKNITVAYTPDAVTMAVVELTIGLMVSLTRKVHLANFELRRGGWSRFTGKRLGESVIGLIGLGRVGSNVLRILKEFRPKEILVNDLKDKTNEIQQIMQNTDLIVRQVTKEEIYKHADIVSIHVPLTNLTRNMIGKTELGLMNASTYVINTARGGIVNESDLYHAVKAEQIAGAAIDVFEKEPYKGNLIELENIILTEHMGSCSFDCRYLMEFGAASEVVRFFKGEPLLNPVPDEELENQRKI